jgi:hypothetical protein
MTKFTIEGVFKDHTIKEKDSKKDEGGKYLAGEVMFEIDNTDGKYGAVEVIPFSVFGKSAEAGPYSVASAFRSHSGFQAASGRGDTTPRSRLFSSSLLSSRKRQDRNTTR